MRLFIALELPSHQRDNIARSAQQMQPFATRGNFVPRQNYHITLHFLGEVVESNLIYIQSAMDAVRNMPAPELSVQQFAVLRGSDVVVAKIRNTPALQQLHEALGHQLEKNNRFSVEHRAYRPHVTVMRKFAFNIPFAEVTKSVDVFNKPFEAADIVLYQSTLTKDGPTYNELYRVTLPSNPQ